MLLNDVPLCSLHLAQQVEAHQHPFRNDGIVEIQTKYIELSLCFSTFYLTVMRFNNENIF
jgi:hypothetical protein